MSSAKKSATPSNKSAKAKKKKEEEERRKKEEEEAQLRAELAEKERLENEKKVADERKNAAKEINELRRRELSEFYDFIYSRQDQANRIRQKQREDFQWKRYSKCDGTPDPTVLKEINTFVSLWREEKQLEIEYTLDQTNLVLSLIDELHLVISSIPKDSSELEQIPIYRKTIQELEDVLHFKWLQTMHCTMLKATDFQNAETNNFQYTEENENVTLCVWGNLSHNPRIKNFQFEKYGFGFDLPKPLSLANIAILGFFLKYDYYSERSPLAKCRVRPQKYSFDPIPEALPDDAAKQNPEDLEKDEFDSSLPAELRKLMEQSRPKENRPVSADSVDKKEIESSTQNAQSATAEANFNKEPSNVDQKSIADEESINVLEELADESVIDLRSHWPILPLIQLDLVNIPPQPKRVQEWRIMEMDPNDTLLPYSYPSDPMIAERFYEEFSASQKAKLDGKGPEKPEEPADPSMTLDATVISNNPEVRRLFLAAAAKQETAIALKFKVPTDVYLTEKPLLARWIKEKKHWRQEGYVDYHFVAETRAISFKTYDFGTYALLSDRHAHMPFQSWRLRPKGLNHALFTLNTTTFEIHFEIKNAEIAIFLPARKVENAPEEKATSIFASKFQKQPAPQSNSSMSTSRTNDEGAEIYKTNPTFAAIIEPIANRFMTVQQLVQKLRSIGVNVFPEPDSESYVSVINKNHRLEWLVYNQMSVVASAVAFSYSHWNAFVNDEMKIVVGCKEHLLDQSTADEDLQCIIFTNELVGMTDVCESSQEFVEASTFSNYHAEILHLAREKFSSEANSRIEETNPLFIETVLEILQRVKPLTYA